MDRDFTIGGVREMIRSGRSLIERAEIQVERLAGLLQRCTELEVFLTLPDADLFWERSVCSKLAPGLAELIGEALARPPCLVP
jgi:hypothetical protein